MSHNPFTSKIYQDNWLKHFVGGKTSKSFSFIKGLSFYKHAYLPYYINVGKNSTNGITYQIDAGFEDYKGKTFLIYDVPEYCMPDNSINLKKLKSYKVRQYKGFLADLKGYDNLESYMLDAFSAKSRNKHRSTIKKLEACFDVSYHIYDKTTSKNEYDQVIQGFRDLVLKRYDSLQLDTNLIGEWSFYEEVIYPMLKNGQALMINVCVEGKPEAMSLVFVEDTKITGAIKAFNPDFYKFNIGHIELGKLIEWCFENGINTLDFSKGEYEYKTKWTNREYLYHCHIVYDSSSFTSGITAFFLAKYFQLKQYLRDKRFNYFVVKMKYKFKNLKGSSGAPMLKISSLSEVLDFDSFQLVDLENDSQVNLKRIVYDMLYRKQESIKNVAVYKQASDSKTYYIVGRKSQLKVEVV